MGKMTCVNPSAVRDFEIPEVGKFKIGVLLKDAFMLVQEAGMKGNPMEAAWIACKYGVKGHEGLTFEDGAEVPFKTVVDEKGRAVVSDDTLQVYMSSGLMDSVATECLPKGRSPKAKA